MSNTPYGEAKFQHPEYHWADLPFDPESEHEDEEAEESTEPTFGNIPVGTRFTIDSNGVTFEKTSNFEARMVTGNTWLLGVPSQFGLLKPVRIVPRE